MFEHLADHDRILVTGPQRSGTTIAARMIAADTGHTYIDEDRFRVTDVAAWRRLLAQDGVTVHCPHMLKRIVDDPPMGCLVVLMRRRLGDIHASIDRIGWSHAPTELRLFGVSAGDPAKLKYDYWASADKAFPYIELRYSDLRRHRLWIGRTERQGFEPRQTERSADGR